ncbi:MAG TPA: hypothetical protein VFK28_11720 [Sphingomicrobium sp.]|jgi:hypothetical protein|nr:hypothetical protein [Sphingomicrobium sp.]
MNQRELFVSLAEETVEKRCLDAHVGISALESLASGGTRLVCMSGSGAETMRTKFKRHLISTPVVRRPYRPKSRR